jgi:hypothetical protein
MAMRRIERTCAILPTKNESTILSTRLADPGVASWRQLDRFRAAPTFWGFSLHRRRRRGCPLGASCWAEAVEEDEPPDIVDEVDHAHLHRRPGDVRMKRSILSFCAAKTCSTRERTFDFSALARRVVSGIGPSGGSLRWMRLTKPFFARKSSLALERKAVSAHTALPALAC